MGEKTPSVFYLSLTFHAIFAKKSSGTLANKEIIMSARTLLMTSCFSLALAVLFGAFGAHGLEGKVSAKALATFETGSRYHFYHSFGLFLIGLWALHSQQLIKWPAYLMIVGIILFSFNCYLYAITGVKAFAMIVPLGGISFVISWILMARRIARASPNH
jgi:uncharacterized membrane protein YgdD (TMEM256/DUF423 family)